MSKRVSRWAAYLPTCLGRRARVARVRAVSKPYTGKRAAKNGPANDSNNVTVPITSADDGLKWRLRALYPEGAASRGACVSYMGTNHTS